MYSIAITRPAAKAWSRLLKKDPLLYEQIEDALAQLEENPLHPGLRSHRYQAFPGAGRAPVWESYVTQGGGAWRIWWQYGPDEVDSATGTVTPVVTVIAIGPHPK